MGYQAGVIVGKASDPQSWEAAYFYKLVETDATVADLADSDFGNGGTNRKDTSSGSPTIRPKRSS